MVAVFREVRRVLRDDGTLWLNLGDSYGGGSGQNFSGGASRGLHVNEEQSQEGHYGHKKGIPSGLPSGNLVGIPWRTALALQADGWILRQDIIWHKPAPMPESVKNRCTKAHEYVFLFAKKQGYFYDAEAIKQQATEYSNGGLMNKSASKRLGTGLESTIDYIPTTLSNKRSVWSISSQGFEGAHFATFPPRLIEPMIKAGTSEKGACCRCGSPWRRVVKETPLKRDRPNDYVKRVPQHEKKMDPRSGRNEGKGNQTSTLRSPAVNGKMSTCANSVNGVEVETLGWEATCGCNEPKVLPCIVLDPFVGSGTTVDTSVRLRRVGWGIDLNKNYLDDFAIPRVEDLEACLRERAVR